MENFGSFLFKFGINIRKNIRLIESSDKKLINAELALLFNKTCKKKYIYIYMYILTDTLHGFLTGNFNRKGKINDDINNRIERVVFGTKNAHTEKSFTESC